MEARVVLTLASWIAKPLWDAIKRIRQRSAVDSARLVSQVYGPACELLQRMEDSYPECHADRQALRDLLYKHQGRFSEEQRAAMWEVLDGTGGWREITIARERVCSAAEKWT